MYDDIIILIPTLNPDERLVTYIGELRDSGFSKIIVVDDGSTKGKEIFSELSGKCEVLIHAINMGKGRAIKTGINHILNKYSADEVIGIITADSDGQHCVADTIKIAEKLREKCKVVLGCRSFSGKNVPPKSKFGNNLTMYLFKFLYGKKISDTQTGLRGLSYDVLPVCLSYFGERYEYEMCMLIETVVMGEDIKEVPIETIYYNGNKETHFSVVKDSLRIYRVLLGRGVKYILSSICGFIVDILLFSLLTWVLLPIRSSSIAILISTAIARVFSCITNYYINKNVVFKNKDNVIRSGVKYFTLAAAQLVCSWLMVTILYTNIKWNVSILKIIVDTCLFVVSYKIQQIWIFRNK